MKISFHQWGTVQEKWKNCELGIISLSQKITPMQSFVWNTESLSFSQIFGNSSKKKVNRGFSKKVKLPEILRVAFFVPF